MTDLKVGMWYNIRWLDEKESQNLLFLKAERGFLLFQNKEGQKVVARPDSIEVRSGGR